MLAIATQCCIEAMMFNDEIRITRWKAGGGMRRCCQRLVTDRIPRLSEQHVGVLYYAATWRDTAILAWWFSSGLNIPWESDGWIDKSCILISPTAIQNLSPSRYDPHHPYERSKAIAPEMDKFSTLPTELKLLIVENLARKDLRSLSVTCKKLRLIPLYALFDSVVLTDTASQISSLLRLLMKDPYLSRCIRKIALREESHCLAAANRLPLVYNMESLLDILDHDPQPAKRELYRFDLDPRSGQRSDPALRLLLLLAHCVHLESVVCDSSALQYLETIWNRDTVIYDSIQHNRLPEVVKLPLLRKVRNFIVRCPLPDFNMMETAVGRQLHRTRKTSPQNLSWLSKFPDLRTLEVPLLSDRMSDWHGIKLNLAALRKLTLCHAFAPPQALRLILRRTPNLEELFYDMKVHSAASFSPESLDKALRSVRKSLKNLSLYYTVYPYVEQTPVFQGRLQSLKRFPCLKTLGISLSLLFGPDVDLNSPFFARMLPTTLERLYIRDDIPTGAFGRLSRTSILFDFGVFVYGEYRVFPNLRTTVVDLREGLGLLTPVRHSLYAYRATRSRWFNFETIY
ncbi:unnamed protein product [Periconia digitata]|uniref:F-box domain-containing protein n=1 Tax=Periconia digitata TaxID=1303443 RepID=A0A9W4UDI8_9PLEO|nr:unnamed protein product [Periconia digitata]